MLCDLSMQAVYPTLLLCAYGFFSNLRPSEPFLTAFLMGPDKNLTETQVVNEIYPIWTYSYLVLLFPAFLATDYLRYKPVLILQATSFVATYILLLVGHGLLAMQLVEFAFGVATASDVAYYSYIYSVVEPAHYQRVTGYCRSVTLFGSAAGSLMGQLLLSKAGVRLLHLVMATTAAAGVAFMAPWFLPMPRRSLFFHKASHGTLEKLQGGGGGGGGALLEKAEEPDCNHPLNLAAGHSEEASRGGGGFAGVLRLLLHDFLQCYRCCSLLAWSAWWALATCGYFQIVNYAQALWEAVRPSKQNDIYNGYVETIATLLGAMAALIVGHIPVRWAVWGEVALCVLSLLMSACVFAMDTLGNIWLCYGSYILFRTMYMLLITVATYQIAASLSMQRYALVFGVNTFAALLLQTVLTVVVVDTAGLGLDIFTQFLIYGGYFAVISLVFFVAALCKLANKKRSEPDASADGTTAPPPADGT